MSGVSQSYRSSPRNSISDNEIVVTSESRSSSSKSLGEIVVVEELPKHGSPIVGEGKGKEPDVSESESLEASEASDRDVVIGELGSDQPPSSYGHLGLPPRPWPQEVTQAMEGDQAQQAKLRTMTRLQRLTVFVLTASALTTVTFGSLAIYESTFQGSGTVVYGVFAAFTFVCAMFFLYHSLKLSGVLVRRIEENLM